MHRVLLAEDDLRLANLVKEYLEQHPFQVTIESHGQKVPRKVAELLPDIVILDIMLPGKNGLVICREIRDSFTGPILILTARDSNPDQILGLETGADDYIIKPAEPTVLLARIRALLRRFHPPTQDLPCHYTFGALSLNVNARKVELAQQEVNLSSHQFNLLAELVKHAGKILSREYLFNAVYDRPYDGLDRTVDVHISNIRKILNDSADKPEKIKTVWGKGYVFIADAW